MRFQGVKPRVPDFYLFLLEDIEERENANTTTL